ncbi:triose-phosphate isomerase [Pseudomonas sp. DCB_AW]|uniref:triose-phosphate isomerase n=1 Tax=Pseudomonas sp. DCB_AW TaxID=2993596 RepID=UPI0022492694|nr:triose-phosphate isomerase [Pseudomonas sp. DCB_AW]MCX2684669.1 triose-phosphate isomerase [Pseudomonas sp. DCB_AW]
MANKLVIGNWKMNGSRKSNAELLSKILAPLERLESVDVAICPPFIYLEQLANLVVQSSIQLGAQDLNQAEHGAFTGEISGAMLRDFGCHYVLVGHSERRSLYGEGNDLVATKFQAALRSGLTPVLCVGETLEQRRKGVTLEVVNKQLQAVLDLLGVNQLGGGVLAYEPVWAIGTGETATPEQAQEVHRHIRQYIAENNSEVARTTRILYGGSVKGDNAAELFAQPDIDGGLVGGASLDVHSFLSICKAGQPRHT